MFEYEINPGDVEEADIVVGLASYQEADAIACPTRQASRGLKKYFSDKKSVIINCDNNSPDDTKSAFLGTETDIPKIYITTPLGVRGKGYNLENMFRKAVELGAEVIICIDADLESITPEWIKYFAEPILAGYDYVTPIYTRHKYDATITNNICFPLVYGLLCRNIRQPIGGDFALSRNYARYALLRPWHRTTEEYGIDIFLSMNAILGGFKICQTGLGAKIHKPSAPKLGPMFIQVVGTAFWLIVNNLRKWEDLKEVKTTERFGTEELGNAWHLHIERETLKQKAVDGYHGCKESIERYLEGDTYREVKDMFESDGIAVSDDLWVKIVYQMLVGFKSAENRKELIESLRPLYFARLLTFMNDTWDRPTPEAEKLVVRQAEKFFRNRGYLIERLRA